MPGHKQGRGLHMDDILKIDITEIDGMDNLHHAESIILESEKTASEIFGADESFFLINGSSCGVIAAILAVCNRDDKIVVARNSHKSVYSGIIFSGAKPVYITPDIVDTYGFSGGIEPNQLERYIQNAKAVLITSPTYEGFTSNIKAIADIAHRFGAIVIVDEAHGAHFKFNSSFPMTALEQGADIVIQSLHKTLPSMTQTAILHVQNNLVDRYRLKLMLSMLQSSSPSYVLMSSIDLCISSISEYKFEQFVNNLNILRYSLSKNQALKLIGSELKGKYSISDLDIGKIIIYCCTDDIDGYKLSKLLKDNYSIQVEMNGINHILAIATVSDSKDGFEMLSKAIFEIDRNLEYCKPIKGHIEYTEPTISISPQEAIYKKSNQIEIEKSIGQISAEFIIPYPPAIPLIVPGEIITESILQSIYECKKNCIPILGTKDYTQSKIQIVV